MPLSIMLTRRLLYFSIFAVIILTILALILNTYDNNFHFSPFYTPSTTHRRPPSRQQQSPDDSPTSSSLDPTIPWTFNITRDGHKFSLSDTQCSSAFPLLYSEIDRSISHTRKKYGAISSKHLDENMSGGPGTLRCMIFDGRLFIVDAIDQNNDLFGHRSRAILASINRALVGSQDAKDLPNIEFTLSLADTTWLQFDGVKDKHGRADKRGGDRPTWSFTRKLSDKDVWVIPDFTHWTWRRAHIGTPSDIFLKMSVVESSLDSISSRTGRSLLSSKVQKLFWRGNLETAPILRGNLVNASRDKSWSDVHETYLDRMDYQTPIEEHCKWAFLMYTEGHSYSGRMKYLQNCYSVILAHEMEWFVPWDSLLVSEGKEQNYVKVKRDFSDLDEKMTALIENKEEAERIARNSRDVFRDRYLAPAAEACYWRRLIRGWAEVSEEPEFYVQDGRGFSAGGSQKWRGMSYEVFMLTGEKEAWW